MIETQRIASLREKNNNKNLFSTIKKNKNEENNQFLCTFLFAFGHRIFHLLKI